MSELKSTEDVVIATTLMDKMTHFESEHRPFINLFIRPMLMLIVFLAVGYYTMWMSTNYVKQEKFTTIIEKQAIVDKQQDETAKARFEVIQTKLDTVINNQTAFIEQLKSYNQLMTAYQKQMDSMNDRVIYLERQHKGNQE
jgi:hypothetical protein